MIKDFEFISNKERLEDVHKYLRTNKFWADSWAIGLIEKELNYKFIILSESEYESNNYDNILQCGDMQQSDLEPLCSICKILKSEYENIINFVTDDRQLRQLANPYLEKHNITIEDDSNIKQLLKDCNHVWEDQEEDNSDYNPNGYIILTYSGNHYRLVTYNGNKIFKKFSDLPKEIKENVLRKCKNTGLYKRIPEIQTKKKKKQFIVASGIKKQKKTKKKKKSLFNYLF